MPETKDRASASEIAAVGGVLLAAAPGFGYVISWIHDFGYENTFQIPTQLIAPQLGAVLGTTGLVAGLFVIIYVGAEIYIFVHRGNPIGPIEGRILAIAAAALVIGLVTYGGNRGAWDWLTWTVLAFFVAILAFALFAAGLGGPASGFRERLRYGDQRLGYPVRIGTLLMERFGVFWVLVAGLALVSIQASYDLGIYQAKTQADFFLTDSNPPEVVLGIYGDTVILAPLDRVRHAAKHQIDVVKLGNQPLHLNLETVGPLTAECASSAPPPCL
jgi:hypothetical protein